MIGSSSLRFAAVLDLRTQRFSQFVRGAQWIDNIYGGMKTAPV